MYSTSTKTSQLDRGCHRASSIESIYRKGKGKEKTNINQKKKKKREIVHTIWKTEILKKTNYILNIIFIILYFSVIIVIVTYRSIKMGLVLCGRG